MQIINHRSFSHIYHDKHNHNTNYSFRLITSNTAFSCATHINHLTWNLSFSALCKDHGELCLFCKFLFIVHVSFKVCLTLCIVFHFSFLSNVKNTTAINYLGTCTFLCNTGNRNSLINAPSRL